MDIAAALVVRASAQRLPKQLMFYLNRMQLQPAKGCSMLPAERARSPLAAELQTRICGRLGDGLQFNLLVEGPDSVPARTMGA